MICRDEIDRLVKKTGQVRFLALLDPSSPVYDPAYLAVLRATAGEGEYPNRITDPTAGTSPRTKPRVPLGQNQRPLHR